MKEYSEYQTYQRVSDSSESWIGKLTSTSIKKLFPADIIAVAERYNELVQLTRDNTKRRVLGLYKALTESKRIAPIPFTKLPPFNVDNEVQTLIKKYPNIPLIRSIFGLSYSPERILSGNGDVVKDLF
jgi:hypothetical protein